MLSIKHSGRPGGTKPKECFQEKVVAGGWRRCHRKVNPRRESVIDSWFQRLIFKISMLPGFGDTVIPLIQIDFQLVFSGVKPTTVGNMFPLHPFFSDVSPIASRVHPCIYIYIFCILTGVASTTQGRIAIWTMLYLFIMFFF